MRMRLKPGKNAMRRCYSLLRRQRVRRLDQLAHLATRARGIELLIALDRSRLRGQRLVLDSAAAATARSRPAQVKQPGVVVDAVGQVHEQDQVVRAQVELSLGAAEIEAAVLRQLALGVLAQVAAPLGAARLQRSNVGAPAAALLHSSAVPASSASGHVIHGRACDSRR